MLSITLRNISRVRVRYEMVRTRLVGYTSQQARVTNKRVSGIIVLFKNEHKMSINLTEIQPENYFRFNHGIMAHIPWWSSQSKLKNCSYTMIQCLIIILSYLGRLILLYQGIERFSRYGKC